MDDASVSKQEAGRTLGDEERERDEEAKDEEEEDAEE